MSRTVYLLAFFSLLSLAVFYKAGVDVVDTLSPQGCRMSWMSPSYILQTSLDHTWSPLARRYSLWLYREVGWETHELHGSPVLFIPGNAGSSRQVRSIASSATRQYFSSPHQIAAEFVSETHKPLDFFAVEFNEDLSAFHGTTLESEREYTSRAIDYILSLYPANTSIVVLGHSMGGVVATSLLSHDNIAAIITMSTPYSLPPARFDRRIEAIFNRNRETLASDPTPIMSLCGGATDLMVPSESCYIPSMDMDRTYLVTPYHTPYRRTIFTSALEGCWTGVGHREMVWCHQVRWRIARAAIELTRVTTPAERGIALDLWLRDGHILPPTIAAEEEETYLDDEHEVLSQGQNLVLVNPARSGRYLLPVPTRGPNSTGTRFIMYMSQGSIGHIAPRHPLPLRAVVDTCDSSNRCKSAPPTDLRLIPSPVPGRSFPVPGEGSDESEGIVVFEMMHAGGRLLSVQIEGADGRGWVVAGFVQQEHTFWDVATLAPFLSAVSVKLPPNSLRSEVHLPNVLSSALIVYRLTPHLSSQCSDPLLQPLVHHTSHPSESHYFPLSFHSTSRILLHTHASAPYIPSQNPLGLRLIIYSSGECTPDRLDIQVDWWGTVGRWGVRYWSAVGSWAVSVVSVLVWSGWVSDERGFIPPIKISLYAFTKKLQWLLPLTLLVSFLPLPVDWWLGNGGEPIFAIIAPFLFLIVAGLVCISWWVLLVLMWPIGALLRITGMGRTVATPIPYSRRSTLISMGVVLVSIFLLVPWQVAFLGCWIFHLFTCAATRVHPTPSYSTSTNYSSSIPMTPTTPELLHTANDADFDAQSRTSLDSLRSATPTPPTFTSYRHSYPHYTEQNYQNANEHLLLLMTWLLPLAAPVLAVWVRTLMTAGYTTPFDGDHNVLYVAPFLVLVEVGAGVGGFMSLSPASTSSASTGKAWIFLTSLPRWMFVVLAVIAAMFGPRYTYVVFECASVAFGVTVLARFGPRLMRR